MYYVSNAFSLNMVQSNCQIRVINLTLEQARAFMEKSPESFTGHGDVAAIMSEELGTLVSENRSNLSLQFGDELLVAQYSGPRLAPGATALPEGATIRWIRVVVEYLDFI